MPDEPGGWIAWLVPPHMRERVFQPALQETERAYRARRRQARSALSRWAVELWRAGQIAWLALECRRLADSPHRRAPQTSRGAMTSMVFQDLRFGARTFLKTPGFSAVVILTVALGIGGTAATFSVVQHVLLRPLPYPAADRVMDVNEWAAGRATAVSPPNFIDWRTDNRTFDALAPYQEQNLTLSAGNEPERVDGAAVGAEFFDAFATPPLLGRTFTRNEVLPGASRLVVLSHALWQRRFGSDPGLVGRSVTLEGEPYAVVGIMPERFEFPESAQVWVPLVFGPRDLGANQRGAHYIRVVGRLKAGVMAAQAQSDLGGIEQRIAAQYPDKLGGYSVHVQPLLDSIVGTVRRPLLVLLGAVGFVLLIACVNVSNLLLARATTRTGEIAVRSALGAPRARIVSQLLAESLVLATAGGVAGLMLAFWAIHALAVIAPTDLPRGAEFSIDPPLLAFVVVVSLATGVLFGMVPALVSSRPDVAGFLKDARRGSGTSTRSGALRNALIAAEVALSLILLAGAGLSMRSFDRLSRVHAGFDPSNVLTFSVRLPEARYSTVAAAEQFFRDYTSRLRQPGVQSAGAIFLLPLSRGGFGGTFTILGKSADADEGNAQVRPVTPGYFEALRIPSVAGRRVTDADRAGGPGVACVSETAARRYWPGENPVGQRIRIHVSMGVREETREIVGVIADVRTRALDLAPVPVIYVPASQYVSDEMTFVIRTNADPLQALPIAKTQLAAIDPEVALSRVQTMDDVVAASLAQPKFRTRILGIFATVALALAAVGLYGVVAFSVNQRRAELGLRMALGAHRNDVLRLVLRQGLLPVAVGIIAGLLGAAALTRVMRTLLYEVSAQDPLTFAGVVATLLSVAALACYLPARRAMSVDPVVALR